MRKGQGKVQQRVNLRRKKWRRKELLGMIPPDNTVKYQIEIKRLATQPIV